MRRVKQITLTVLTIFLLTGCDFIKNAFTYKDKTKGFIEAVLNKNYNRAITYFAMEHEMAKDSNPEEMKASFARFREIIVKDFGTELNFTFMNAEKKFSTNKEENTAPNTTVALIEFSNSKEFGIFRVVFDDKSGKMLNINTLDIKKPIPSMIYFWLFGLVALCVPIFNIYVIKKIKRSDLRKKKLKYIAVLFFNVPALTYAAVNGLSFKLLSFQILLGLSFSYMGYLGSVWTFGIPLGGLYWFWKLRQRKFEAVETEIAAY